MEGALNATSPSQQHDSGESRGVGSGLWTDWECNIPPVLCLRKEQHAKGSLCMLSLLYTFVCYMHLFVYRHTTHEYTEPEVNVECYSSITVH